MLGRVTAAAEAHADGVREGIRAGWPIGIAAAVVGLSFGVLAEPVMGAAAAIAFSALVFAGAAQFAALSVLAAGGGAVPAILAGVLLNLRFLPMGLAIAPWISGGRLRRAAYGATIVDASWALSSRGDGRFDPAVMVGATIPQYPLWVLGTAVGALSGDLIGDPEKLGLDAVFPAFFLGLLLEEMRTGAGRAAAFGGAAIALALIPFAPPGIPVLAAALAAVVATWVNRRRA
jgi:predicted branched-subunit amino acid permease